VKGISTPYKVRFGPFELDRRAGELRKHFVYAVIKDISAPDRPCPDWRESHRVVGSPGTGRSASDHNNKVGRFGRHTTG
jgi:hypothetical protein